MKQQVPILIPNNKPFTGGVGSTLGFVQVWLDGITISSSNFSVLQFGA